MDGPDQELETLLTAAASGESSAMTLLLDAVRPPLLHYVARRLDPRVASRIDPADVVQDALLFAARHLDTFLERRAIPFSLWLKQIAQEQVAYVHRLHIRSKKRSVCREMRQKSKADHSSRSVIDNYTVSREPSANRSLEAEELQFRLGQRLQNLPIHEQQLLRLRFFERLDLKAIAENLGITVEALRMRQSRALRHLRALMVDEGRRN
jgi:RNA polymerase sigma-70 factor (ECF subfamily)